MVRLKDTERQRLESLYEERSPSDPYERLGEGLGRLVGYVAAIVLLLAAAAIILLAVGLIVRIAGWAF